MNNAASGVVPRSNNLDIKYRFCAPVRLLGPEVRVDHTPCSQRHWLHVRKSGMNSFHYSDYESFPEKRQIISIACSITVCGGRWTILWTCGENKRIWSSYRAIEAYLSMISKRLAYTKVKPREFEAPIEQLSVSVYGLSKSVYINFFESLGVRAIGISLIRSVKLHLLAAPVCYYQLPWGAAPRVYL